jgi:protocatechuate 3,4-dioxygenase beta subunit
MQQLSTAEDAWKRIAPALDEAVERLGETDRNAVLLRFFEDRSHQQVGAALGLSEEAARKRVNRALEKLRGFFAGRGFVVPAAALASALAANAVKAAPIGLTNSVAGAAFTAGTAATASLPAFVSETLAAWRWTKVKWAGGIGAIALIIVAVVTIERFDAAERSRADQPQTVETAKSTALVPSAATGQEPNAPALKTNQVDVKFLRLRVVAADTGDALTNAPVALSVWTQGTVEKRWNLATDGSGICNVWYSSVTERIDVGVLASGWAARFAGWPSEGLRDIPAEYTLRVERVTNAIGGRIVDSFQRPVADAQVWFQALGTGDYAHRERATEGFGFVWEFPAARTDASGRWSLAMVPTRHPGFGIIARHPDFADSTLVFSDAQQGLDEVERDDLKRLWAGQLVSVMNTAFTLTGAVVDEQSAPIAGAKIQAPRQSEIFTTDADGKFVVPKLKEGRWDFTVSAVGFAPVRTNALIGAARKPAVVTLRTGAVLRVRVIDENGIEVPDAEVGMEQWGENRHDLEWREKTDFNGRIEWRSAPPDVEIELFARKDGFCYTRNVRVKADGEEHTVKLRHALDVYGRVTDAATGYGIRDFRAMPAYGGADRYFDSELRWFASETVRGSNGLFKLTFAENELPWQLRIVADGYEDWTSEPLRPESPLTLDIALKKATAEEGVRGVVLLPDGQPAEGAQVALLTFENRFTLTKKAAFEGNARWLVRTDGTGKFQFKMNRTAHSVAAVCAEGFVLALVLGSQNPMTLQVQPWGRVEGIVDKSAMTHGVEEVRLYDPTADNYQGSVSTLGSYLVKPDTDGRFIFEKVPAGEFSVFINSGIGVPFHHQTPIVVRSGETTSVTIGNRIGVMLSGRFVPPEGKTVRWKEDLVDAELYADLPQPPRDEGPAEERPMRALEFWTSAAGRDYVNTPHVYSVLVRDDGSFVSLEPVPSGKYRFTTVFKNCSTTRHITVGKEQSEIHLGQISLR